ncbi:MAG: FtsQ-type POTRA domain-containing protein [Lachnospiraceae bacterium]|nr:FtsQ-type POTRA domain-containing protein [Lachnospiraceae bacterium]
MKKGKKSSGKKSAASFKAKRSKKSGKSIFARMKEKNRLKKKVASKSKVQKVNFRKKDDTMGKLSKLKRIRLIAILAVVALLIGGAFLFLEGFKVRIVTVEGSTHYTAEEIRNMVITDKLCENSLYLKLKYRDKKIEDIPFVEHMDVQIKDRNTVRIIVYEKAIAGYVTYLENRMYFDKDGIVVESSKESVPGVPEITGLEFDHVILHEALPVENPKIFKEILSLTQLLNKNSLTADRIYFDHLGNITMYFGDIRVDLGDGEYLDERVTHLAAILKEAEPMHIKGRLHMESFTISNPKTTFEVEE